ncbi:hypothetical protein [Yoonia sp. 2307UL14-13]|uniref:hypothetical protein n=1 Tax=Yoonia sp. 2307UL14-13 TaxID=3126506 RepID=UPI0030B7CEB9
MQESFLPEFGLTVGSLIFCVAIVAIIYPFKPFQSRRNAMLVAFACLAAVDLNPAAIRNVEDAASDRNATELALGDTRPDPISPAENDAADPEAARAPTARDDEAAQTVPSERDICAVMTSFEARRWAETAAQFRAFQEAGYDYQPIASEIEERTLAIVRPLPVSQHHANLDGYRLLAAIRPENPRYRQKIPEYENRIERTRLVAVGALRQNEDRVQGIT